jgi:hypothetical protein
LDEPKECPNVPLTALLILDDADGAFNILGVPLVEFQIRQAGAVGASHIVLMVGRLPQALLASIDRLRRKGLTIDVSRTVADTLDFVHPEDRVILVAPRVSISLDSMQDMASARTSLVLATGSTAGTARLDIIDSSRRWTGWAGFEGRLLREVGATVGDWDLSPTILRFLLQKRAIVTIDDRSIVLLDKTSDRQALEARLRDAADGSAEGIGGSLLTRPAALVMARIAGEAGLRPEWIGWTGIGVAVASVAGALAGLIALPAALMLLSHVLVRGGGIMERAVSPGGGGNTMRPTVLASAIALVLLAFGIILWRLTGQWGFIPLVAMLVSALALLRSPLVRARNPLALADAESSFAIVMLAALLGSPFWGLTLATVHAAASVIARQWGKGPQP